MKMRDHHEYTNMFDMAPNGFINKLSEEIKKNGLLKKIVTYKGKIIDGRARQKSCILSGLNPIYEEYTGHDFIGYMISQHCDITKKNESQKAMMVIKVKDNKELIKYLSVSKKQIEQAKKLLNEGDVELIRGVRNGDISLSQAVDILHLCKEDQNRITLSHNPHNLIKKERIKKANSIKVIELDDVDCSGDPREKVRIIRGLLSRANITDGAELADCILNNENIIWG